MDMQYADLSESYRTYINRRSAASRDQKQSCILSPFCAKALAIVLQVTLQQRNQEAHRVKNANRATFYPTLLITPQTRSSIVVYCTSMYIHTTGQLSSARRWGRGEGSIYINYIRTHADISVIVIVIVIVCWFWCSVGL